MAGANLHAGQHGKQTVNYLDLLMSVIYVATWVMLVIAYSR